MAFNETVVSKPLIMNLRVTCLVFSWERAEMHDCRQVVWIKIHITIYS